MDCKSGLFKIFLLVCVFGLLSACDAPPENPPVSEGDNIDASGETIDVAATAGFRPANNELEASAEAVEEAFILLAENEREIAQGEQNRSFEEFEASVYREPNGGKYIVNGDVAIADRKHLQEFFENEVKNSGPVDRGLIVHQSNGGDAVWDAATKLNLTYCVSRTFQSRYSAVVDAMVAATQAWESVADINFIHDSAQDDACTATNAQVVFDVRPVNSGSYLARAFFPDDSRGNRNVLIDNSSFSLDSNGNLSLIGILRHELGHSLGFRHEHTRPESGTCFEDDNWRPLTSYDAFSVMHYPQCNGGGDWTLSLTDFDGNGAACLYGAAPGFTIDTNVCTPEVIPTPPAGCGPQTVSVSGSVTQGQEVVHGPYAVAPGTEIEVTMMGSGDPDLYLRFGESPTRGQYDCRPYLSGAQESCSRTVPAGASEVFLMVRGYRAGSYQLTVEHTRSP